jgi:hypothetical protein
LNPELSKEWHPTKNGKLTPSDIVAVSSKKVWWKCAKGHEYLATPTSRKRGDGCRDCAKIRIKDGFTFDSLTEAYYYLSEFKDKGIKFDYHVNIGLGRCNCDFYVPYIGTYIEVTAFTKNWRHWKSYYKNIIKKKNHITKVLKAKFQFVQLQLTPKQIQYVRENSL